MNIKFLGTGGAFDFEKGNAAAIVEMDGKNILIDCGFTTLPKLASLDLLDKIDYILVTHLHGDHSGGLSTLLVYAAARLKKKIPIIVPTDRFHAELVKFFTLTDEIASAEFVPISDFPNIGYIDTTGHHKPGLIGKSYYFKEDDHLIYYSGDIGNADVAANFLADRTESNIQVFHETTHTLNIANHASYKEVEEELGKYDTYVYHIAKENMPADCTLKYVENYPEFCY
jgi:glyoxylase-like metal-dependent hydrolase (beta-lactamase superfamily II)